MGACTRKRGNVCMSESGTCIASTSSSLTLRAHYVHHSSSIPCNLVFTCAGGMQESPNPPETRRRQPQRFNETTTVCGQACLLCYASSRVDGLQREGGGWVSWRFSGRRVRWRGGVVYVVLFVHPGSFYPRGVRGGGFGLALPRHTLLVIDCVWAYYLLFLCPRACGLCVWWRWRPLWWRVAPVSEFRGAGRPSYHRIFPLGIPSYHSCAVPRCWRLLVLRVFFRDVHIFSGVGGFLPR